MSSRNISALALIALFFVWMTSGVMAQTPAAAPAAGTPAAAISAAPAEENPYAAALTLEGFVQRTGVMAYPLITLSMITAFFIVLFTFTVRQGTVVSDAFMNSADALIRKQDYLGLLAVCNRRNECIARVTAKTLDFATRNPTASFGTYRLSR
jgi:biopolymer transport protein ExbB